MKRFVSILLLVAFVAAVFGGPTAHATGELSASDPAAVTAEVAATASPADVAPAPDVGAPATPAAYEPKPAPCPEPLPAGEPATYLSHVTPTAPAPDRLHGPESGGLLNQDSMVLTGAALNRGRSVGSPLLR